MTITLRIVLIVASILTCTWIIQRIRKAQIKIEDSVFWILFSGVLILMSIFPRLVEWGKINWSTVSGQLCVSLYPVHFDYKTFSNDN